MGFGASTFEIKKGKSGDAGDDLETGPIGPIILPMSMTGQAEEESLKHRFGVEELPQIDQQHANVTLTQSAGAGGPERSWKSTIVAVIVLLVLAGGALLYFSGALSKMLGQ